MTAQIIPVAVVDLVVFGATGDLAMRKLLPGLYHRDSDGQLPAEARVIGAARSELTREAYLGQVEAALVQFVGEDPNPEVLRRFLGRVDYVHVDAMGGSGSAILPPRPSCSARSAAISLRPNSSQHSLGSCWRSRSAAIWPRRKPSTTRSPRSSPKNRPIASTIIWARRRSRT